MKDEEVKLIRQIFKEDIKEAFNSLDEQISMLWTKVETINERMKKHTREIKELENKFKQFQKLEGFVEM